MTSETLQRAIEINDKIKKLTEFFTLLDSNRVGMEGYITSKFNNVAVNIPEEILFDITQQWYIRGIEEINKLQSELDLL